MAKKVLIFPLSHWGSFQSGQKDSRLCICWLTGKGVSAIHPFSNTTSSELGVLEEPGGGVHPGQLPSVSHQCHICNNWDSVIPKVLCICTCRSENVAVYPIVLGLFLGKVKPFCVPQAAINIQVM